ncbi:MAG: hypothetical protein H0U95_13105 [Bacteroidetes bacterium]|nr:hypothetical protein [Bacteroidota bacterium]
MESFDTITTIELLLKNWKKLAIVSAIAVVFSIVISSPFIMPPDYRSTFVLYPTNIVPFSKESGAEQLFQFLSSEEIKIDLTKRFDLFKHYEIDATEEKAQSKFNKLYNSNIQIKFTRYQSIEVSVIDQSPEFAQKLGNGMIEEVNNLIRKRKKEKYTEYVELYTKQLNSKKNEIDSLENKLKFMRLNYGLLDIGTQSKIVSKKLGKKDLNESDKALLNNLKEHGGEFAILNNQFFLELENYKMLKQTYDKNITDFNGNLSYTTIVSYPDLPDKKNSPHRTVLVLMFMLSSIVLTGLVIITKDKFLRAARK